MNIELIGWIANLLGISAFIPQAVKVYRTDDTESLSLGMYIIISLSLATWIIYGYILNLPPVFYGNIILIILAIYILIKKIIHLRNKDKLLYNNLL